MKISKSVTEKIVFKDHTTDQFRGREFGASREITVPDNSPLEFIQLKETELNLDLRKQVLTNFLLEGVISPDAMKKDLAGYEHLYRVAEQAWQNAQMTP